MNTQSMGLPSGSYYNPTDFTDYTGANRIVWMVIHVIADVKFISTFSILFGAGILLQGQRVATRGLSPAGVHYRRMIVLLFIGIVHAYALWYGDVLVPYAICGMLLFPIRKLPAPLLMVTAILCIAMGTVMRFAIDHQLSAAAIQIDRWHNELTVNTWGSSLELEVYRAGWWRQMDSRFWISLDNDTATFLTWTFWRCGGCMVLGMALLQAGFFHGDWSRKAYAVLSAMCIPLGWCITGLGIVYNEMNEWDATALWSFGEQFNYWGSLVAAFGYLSLGVLVAIVIAERAGTIARVLSVLVIPFRSVGRMALTNYISDTLIGTTYFYGHGLGKFGSLDRVHLLYMTLIIWACQLTLSTIYLRFFKQGPLEWIWHKIVYGTILQRPRGFEIIPTS
jgi:uncharacterized protein